ncbi:hypothetical protein B0J11DRAFT_52452 [Dendryphion nanum]|uniref:BZIP domain-containing protein n=1 Tax=Dendryphion nanum TaxID=256645 RepID=A0A9P9IHL8_9PLEO|nr:hypothetical protein B0J11DRAFT_52452 [Dendryphion nanum]
MSSPSSISSNNAEPSHGKKRVSAEHTLNRVRENQRRHRARRKDYIETLEQRLADTERQLEEAKSEIERLRAGRNDDQWSFNIGVMVQAPIFAPNPNTPVSGMVQEVEENLGTMEVLQNVAYDFAQQAPVQQYNPLDADISSAIILTPPPEVHIATPEPSGPPPCCIEEQLSSPSPAVGSSAPDPECVSCKTRPPPAPTESTTLCSQAYVLIAQQNFRGIDPATIRTWLFQGFRRAQRKGEGCRVENTALMSLLDFISGCEERVGVPCGHQNSHDAGTGDCLF